MATLEVAVEESAGAQSNVWHWGGRERMVLLGSVMLLAAATLAIVGVLYLRPVSRYEAVGPEKIRESCQQLSPWRSWQAWEVMKNGIDPRPDQKYVEQARNFFTAIGVAAALAIVGIGLLAQGIRGARGRQRSTG
jgi:hypothetical protein